MASGTYVFEIDWNNDGTFSGTGENVTARTLHLEVKRGRDVASQLTGRSVAGVLRAVLNNESGDYNSFNASSPLYGSLLPGRLVQCRMTAPTAGTLWRGYLDRLIPNPRIKELDTVTIEAIGPLGYIGEKQVSLPSLANITTGSANGSLLDQAGWGTGAALRDIDQGQTTMRFFWTDRNKLLDAMRKVEETESGFIRESKTGQIVFENRQRRLTSPYTASQATFSDDPTGTLVFMAIEQEDPLPFIFNDFSAEVFTFGTGSTGTLWVLRDSGTLTPVVAPDGGSRIFWAQFPNSTSSNDEAGVDTWIVPVATTDWTLHKDQAGTGTDLTGTATLVGTSYGNQLKIIITNNSVYPGYVTKLQARGIPLLAQESVIVGTDDAASGTKYGQRTYPSKGQFVPDTNEADDWAKWNVSIYKEPTVRLGVVFEANRSNAHLTQAVTREVSDRITLIATSARSNLGINADFFIENIEHKIEADRRHTVKFLLSEARQFSDAWVLDTSALGTTTRLAY